RWAQEQERAMERLKAALVSAPALKTLCYSPEEDGFVADSVRGGCVRAGFWGNFTAGGPGWQAAPSTLRERPVDTSGVSIRRGEARMPRASAGGEEIPLLPLWCQVSGGDRCPHPGSPAEPPNVGSAEDCGGPLD